MHPLFEPLQNIFPPEMLSRVLLVGGAVRDWLTGKSAKDLDLVGFLTAEELRAVGFRPLTPVSSQPVHFLHRPGLGVVEFTPLGGLADMMVDLGRRDFTVNALAMDMAGEVMDPTGGRGDLERRLLSPCSSRCFRDDPLRIFRGFRFETEGWRLTPEAEELIRQGDWQGALADLPLERFSGEMTRALAATEPVRFFQRMVELEVGDILLPELFRMAQVPAGPLAYHPEGDLLTHSLQALERMTQLRDAPLPRFCALFHDLGKLSTPADTYPRHLGHDQAGSAMAGPFCQRLRLPATWRRALAATSLLHLTAARWDELRLSTRLALAEKALQGGIASYLPALVAADGGKNLPEDQWQQALEVAQLPPAALGIRPELLEGPLALPPAQRAPLVHQHRCEALRQKKSRQG
jgi:tRNA nucleotidyltransferase (CCA-adding enzyme)